VFRDISCLPLIAAFCVAGPAANAQQAQQNQGGEEDEEEYNEGGNSFLLFAAVPSWLVSMLFHIIVLLIAAFLTFTVGGIEPPNILQVTPPEEEEVEEIEEFEEEEFDKVDIETETVADIVPQPDTDVIAEEPVLTPANDLDSAAIAVELSDVGTETAPANDLMSEIGSYTGTGLDGRGAAARSALVRDGGGTAGSEAAVAAALKWLAQHQMADGSWNFDHRRGGPCQTNPGTATSATRGATAMALLPFLGAGQTHKEGKYRATVKGGLNYLVRSMKVQGNTASMHESAGNMYSHGLGAIVLTEAYGMTRDQGLMAPAQMALNFISHAQDPVGGGWRYSVQQKGDTSVVGWQLMALKSGHMAYLEVNPNTVKGAMKFLDSVQANSGANYGYTGPGTGTATTAIGLLCRMYLGWKHDTPALERGVEWISNKGPSKGNMYYNYYATQVMRHYEGEHWKKWNPKMRDYLVETQAKKGAETGSWYFGHGDHGASKGGRIYCTSMATMILEVYYRHLPIYRKQASEDEFAL